jgi:hypothetical protein
VPTAMYPPIAPIIPDTARILKTVKPCDNRRLCIDRLYIFIDHSSRQFPLERLVKIHLPETEGSCKELTPHWCSKALGVEDGLRGDADPPDNFTTE